MQTYLFRPTVAHSSPPPDEQALIARFMRIRANVMEGKPMEPISPLKTPPPVPPFRYNPIHDFESLWWLAVYFLFNREIIQDTDTPPDSTETAGATAHREFDHEPFGDLGWRQRVICGLGVFQSHVETLHPTVRPLGYALDGCREMIVEAYHAAEKDLDSVPSSVAENLCYWLMSQFFRMAHLLKGRNVMVRPFTVPEPEPYVMTDDSPSSCSTGSSKRSRTEMEGCAGSSPTPEARPSPPKKFRRLETSIEGGPATRTRSKTRATAR